MQCVLLLGSARWCHLTNDFNLNLDLIVTEGDAAWILLRSQMEDRMELLLQKHVL